MKKILAIITAALLAVSLAACSEKSPDSVSSDAASKSSKPEQATTTVTLYADFSCGSTDTDSIKEYPVKFVDKITADSLAGSLSHLTGLDFYINVTKCDDGLIVDWTKNSTLIANLDDREQKEDFFFHDADTLRWFMMDSLYKTLTENLDVENIYYTMDGGKELEFDELSATNVFPSDSPYMGSAFYYAHSDVKGD